MITISNQKVAGFEPRWADFRGYSLLFDNPGQSLTPSGALLVLNCQVEIDPELGFYKALNLALTNIGREMLIRSYLFCPLPPPSYHVTVWDGGNNANSASAASAHRSELEAQLRGLPLSLPQKNTLTDVVLGSPLAGFQGDLIFRFDRLLKWGNSVLVARIIPTEECEDRYQQMVDLRAGLSSEFEKLSGIKASPRYSPHVSLGYFANQEAAQQATSCIDEWTAMVRQQIGNERLCFRSMSLYGFTDMAHFFKANPRC